MLPSSKIPGPLSKLMSQSVAKKTSLTVVEARRYLVLRVGDVLSLQQLPARYWN